MARMAWTLKQHVSKLRQQGNSLSHSRMPRTSCSCYLVNQLRVSVLTRSRLQAASEPCWDQYRSCLVNILPIATADRVQQVVAVVLQFHMCLLPMYQFTPNRGSRCQ